MPISRNKPCPCGSRRKFKHCCDQKLEAGDIVKLQGIPFEGIGLQAELPSGQLLELVGFKEEAGRWEVRAPSRQLAESRLTTEQHRCPLQLLTDCTAMLTSRENRVGTVDVTIVRAGEALPGQRSQVSCIQAGMTPDPNLHFPPRPRLPAHDLCTAAVVRPSSDARQRSEGAPPESLRWGLVAGRPSLRQQARTAAGKSAWSWRSCRGGTIRAPPEWLCATLSERRDARELAS